MAKLVVLEANEIPLDLLRWYATQSPASTIAHVLETGTVGETEVCETLDKELYPSQTWASLATGVPYEKHHIYWYGDPKPAEFPLYWQIAAEHRSVGIVGTLHSSPLEQQGKAPGLRFALPDSFASTSTTLPRSLEPLQRFNLAMTAENGRAVSLPSLLAGIARDGFRTLRRLRNPRTITELCRLSASIAAGRVSRERLRTAQFHILADIFEHQMQEHDPDLGVMFTNHVAAAMHRYWYASFPDDWEDALYDADWVAANAGEIPAALDALDAFLERILRLCQDTDRTLVLISSMGQVGGGDADATDSDHEWIVRDPHRFMTALGIDQSATLHQAMVPHLSFAFDDVESAKLAQERLSSLNISADAFTIDRSNRVTTITYGFDPSLTEVIIDDVVHAPAALGLEQVTVSSHKNGTHHPVGTIIVANSSSASMPSEPVDYLEVAPALLKALDVDPLDHHRVPSLAV